MPTAIVDVCPHSHTNAHTRHTSHRGPLALEEERLYRLRQEREGEARKALKEERERLEKESRETMVCVCITSVTHAALGSRAWIALLVQELLEGYRVIMYRHTTLMPVVHAGGQAVCHALWR